MSQAFHKDFSASAGSGRRKRTGSRRKKGRRPPSRPNLPRNWLIWLTGALAVVLLLAIGSNSGTVSARASVPHEEWLPPAASETMNETIRREAIRSGDTVIAALERLGISGGEAYRIINAAKKTYDLKHIRAGHYLKTIQAHDVLHLFYNIDNQTRLHMMRKQQQWQATIDQRSASHRRLFTQGIIHGSLFESAAIAGLDSRTTMNLVDIFAWDIDFARDMRDGDSFKVLYDEHFDDEGNPSGSTILAAEFINQGHRYQAVLFTRKDGSSEYYTPDGKSMRKAYLKAPVKFTRISSRFHLRRKHPILGFTRAHRGVDYAAPSGTPVRAIGDGHIRYIGWKGGYGRFIEIRHVNAAHSTAYAHLRSYAKGMHRGTKVRQGQVIGYVGMSGLATGPHLHFEFRVRGRAINPLTLKSVPSKPVPAGEMARFKQQRDILLARLQQTPVLLAWE